MRLFEWNNVRKWTEDENSELEVETRKFWNDTKATRSSEKRLIIIGP